MIHGVGTDVVQVSRMEAAWKRHGEAFAKRILMPQELQSFAHTKNPVRFLAMRFAAKEAIVKAMGTGFRHGVWVRDVGMVPDFRGKPCVIFSARGEAVCRQLGVGQAHVSLTDEAGLVVAMAVAEKAEGA
ncbi:MAG TPA: holo-ACP synthase [Gammaproteobacteria bacterium]|jgi:holo-[acyl-carrier protein] synthase|nr:holo-ACP synthase [Gammaproteobacteria bacterium]